MARKAKAPAEPKPIGRPSDYSPELAELICNRLSDGESVIELCRDEAMPSKRSVMRWLAIHPDFAKLYAIAKEQHADALVQEAKEILDDGSADYKIASRRDGGEELVVDHEHIRRSIARAEHRTWYAGQIAPKKYGPKVDINATVTTRAVEVSDDELLAIAAGGGAGVAGPTSRPH